VILNSKVKTDYSLFYFGPLLHFLFCFFHLFVFVFDFDFFIVDVSGPADEFDQRKDLFAKLSQRIKS
jgi:hypothetical protein